MISLRGLAIGALALVVSAPALSLTMAEALVFDHKVAGVYRDGSDDGLVYLQRSGEHMIMAQGGNSIALLIDSVSVDSIIEHTVNAVDGDDDIHTLNLVSSMMSIYDSDGGSIRMTRIRDLTQRDLAHTKPMADMVSEVVGTPAQDIRASFPCEKAGTKIERMICADATLAELDVTLAARYKSEMMLSDDKDLSKREQRAWIKERNQCSTPQCVADSYKNRIDELDTVIRYMNKPAEFR